VLFHLDCAGGARPVVPALNRVAEIVEAGVEGGFEGRQVPAAFGPRQPWFSFTRWKRAAKLLQ